MRCKKMMFILSMFIVCVCWHENVKAQTNMEGVVYEEESGDYTLVNFTEDDFLRALGMDEEKIQSLDEDIKAFIVSDLKESEDWSDCKYLNGEFEEEVMMRATEVLTGIEFSVATFKVTGEVKVYPTYEFTDKKKPAGNDCFSVQLGNALEMMEGTGKMWYYDDISTNSWIEGGNMVTNALTLSSAEYSGSQLGTPDYPMKIKGCAVIRAQIGSGTDKRVALSYLYNPKNIAYSVSAPLLGGFGVSYSSTTGKIYSAAKIFELNY